MAKEEYKSRVYTDRPAYADLDAPAKFQAIQSIIAKRLKQHPNAICSYKKDRMEAEKIRTDGRQLYIDDLEEN